MFFRLSVDRFVDTEQAVILDSEVFVFDNWDESRLYDPDTGNPRCFYWVPAIPKPTIDYRLYRGSAFLLHTLPGLEGALDYASSETYRRHISGVVLFSTANVAELWRRLERETDLERNLDQLFNHQEALAFSDHDLYGIAVDYGLFESVVPTTLHANLLGWYDNLDDAGIHSPRPVGWDVDRAAAVVEPGLAHRTANGTADLLPSQVALLEQLRTLEGPHHPLGHIGPGPSSPWSTDTIAVQRKLMATTAQLVRLAHDVRELLDARQELGRIADERLVHIRHLEDVYASLQSEVADLTHELAG
jgi:hypothetical protein